MSLTMGTNPLTFEILRVQYNGLLMAALKGLNINLIEEFMTKTNTDIDMKSPLDQAFRDVLLHHLQTEFEANRDNVNVQHLQDLVTLCIQCCRKNMVTPTMPVYLLNDMFELLTLDSCEEIFTFVEKQVNVWKEDLFFSSCKNNLLRMCNDLLRRLSRSFATVFCGRILLFLAKFFPFSERSGLNIISEFNLENITEYGSENSEGTVQMEVDDKDSKQKNIVIDYSLYCKFWSLQDFFRNPNQCYNKVQWKLFCTHANSIINTFQGLKLDFTSKDVSWTDMTDNEPHEMKVSYLAKYLTNQKLLDLQIYDVNFRRFVLLQFLILFQYLTLTVRFKTDSFELKVDQKEWVQTMQDKIYALLRETPPDGQIFSEIISNILQREDHHWNVWKNDGCPEFRKALPPHEGSVIEKREPTSAKPELGDLIKEATENDRYNLGTPELTKLWNLYPDNLEACKDRDFLPSLDSYMSEAYDLLDQGKLGTDEDHLLKDGNFGWRALRLMARRTPLFFVYSQSQISTLSQYLAELINKLGSERPGNAESKEENEQNIIEMEELDIKEPDAEDIKPQGMDDETDETYFRFKVALITLTQFDRICEKLAPDWKKAGSKLGFEPDAIEYLESQSETELTRVNHLLRLWFEDDDDATLENFLYILEGLELSETAEEVKLAIQQNVNINIG